MSKHDANRRLRHMLSHAQEAVTLTESKTRADLDTDRILSLAIVRLLEIVGEAANRVPHAIQVAHPDIPWPQIIGLRNRVIHGYDTVDFDVVWEIIRNDLPPLIQNLEAIIAA